MTIRQRIGAGLAAALKSIGVWRNAVLLAAFPFTDEILAMLNDRLPSFAPYLPSNVYKWVGLVVVFANVAHAIARAHRMSQTKGEAHG